MTLGYDHPIKDTDKTSKAILKGGNVNLLFTVDGEDFSVPLFK